MRLVQILITSLLLLQCGPSHASNDSIRFKLIDGSTFIGTQSTIWSDSTSNYFKGLVTTTDFCQSKGYYQIENESFNPLFVRITNAATDTILSYLSTGHGKYIRNIFSKDLFIYDEITGNSTDSIFSYSKSYDSDKNRWTISYKFNDYQYGCSYTPQNDSLKDISTSSDSDSPFMWTLHYIIMIILSLAILFYPLVNFWDNPILSKIIVIISVALIFLGLILVDTWTQKQLSFIFFSLLPIPLLSALVRKKLLHLILHALLCTIVISSWIYFLFYNLNDNATLSDGTKVSIHWRKGTDCIKRHLIKKMLNKMVPVSVSDHGKQYTVYVNKHEFSETDFKVLNDEMYEWAFALFGIHEKPLNDFSFREAQIVLSMIKNLSDIKLDFLSYHEWQSASRGIHHAIRQVDSELRDVDDGAANEVGLVNIADNASEYSSSYAQGVRISICGDTLYPSFDGVLVCGNAFSDDEPKDSTIINKNLRIGSVGFRLSYRPQDIGAQKFHIIGHLRSDISISLPRNILLVSVNGRYFKSFDSYESFEEFMIENRGSKKLIEAIDHLNPNSIIKITMPPGLGYYDFVPYFSFVGIDD